MLKDIYYTAQHSIALPLSHDDLAVETFQLQVRRYHELTQDVQQLQNRSEEVLQNNPDCHRLQTMPGIGPIISLIIMAESGDLRRFCHHKQYLAFCGFNLTSTQSGQFQSRTKMSKRGNAMRYAYWLAAVSAIRQRENSFKFKYERYMAKDPVNADLKRKAYSAIAAKMARVAHSLIKRGEDYRGLSQNRHTWRRDLINGPWDPMGSRR
ncbi:transposase [Dethiosulfatarculus sandiegensis]|uniref:Transposase IS116/IS110/IS902 C-terminal domain-containing protein n=1 Tax=Dethiosulfatarculus sandiegensis TaxID=1429043 RepID=A0A0D2J7D8_9BACT|nr:transposase [Dethiosulfatarculus sandiegensis]KIX11626.1 hypothetical protein X474_23365 [Dethiosulfatarculus sandiegensis]